ncbi:MAG: hypothetical protein JSW43_13620 [Gemmatimonadota bacterium]|nr:MAG: hypothetical protein JSW43_13620 [Gemmatimonadota bacterium]
MTVSSVIALPTAFASRYGAPVITHIDTDIFRRTYFTHCLQCDFCDDWCCQHGVDVDLYHYERIQRHADGLERYTRIPREQWFTGEVEQDPEVPGGGSHRTRVVNGSCVFRKPRERGCLLHAYCLEEGLDHRELKSMVDCLFPLTFYDDILCVADEVDDEELVCLDTGPTIYRGGREELVYYFGEAFAAALDTLEARVLEA